MHLLIVTQWQREIYLQCYVPYLFQERKLCAHPRLEIYKGDKIYFICPLARQGDFYVPEMKELEKKNRAAAAAVETDDDQTDITGTYEL